MPLPHGSGLDPHKASVMVANKLPAPNDQAQALCGATSLEGNKGHGRGEGWMKGLRAREEKASDRVRSTSGIWMPCDDDDPD